MSFEVLDANGRDAERWRALLERLPAHARDLHYTPEYGSIYRDTYGYEPLLACRADPQALVVQAFVRRPLGALAFLAGDSDGQRYTDIATPYGFGGPLAVAAGANGAAEALRAFDREYRAWCQAQGIASEFVCLHPLLGNHAPIAASGIAVPVPTKQVVAIDLRASEQALWAALSRGTRSSIRRAERLGVQVERVQPDAAALASFRALYLATMRRRGAAERWLFPESYFADCVRRLGQHGSALFFARCEGELAAAYLLINDARTAYYHFGASNERWSAHRPSNLLMYRTLLWAKQQGLARYHLGGGVGSTEDDSLLRFKSSFGGARAMLYTYGRMLNEDVYRLLCARKLEHERVSRAPVPDPDYFPMYRR